MSADGLLVADRARTLVGVRYRPQGRSREGLDCVGVAAAALGLDIDKLPRAYSRRGSSLEELERTLGGFGLIATSGAALEPGDLLVFQPGPAQLHLAILTDNAFVHADAGLRRVVERPLPAPWPIAGFWRAATLPTRGEKQWPPWS